MADSGSFYTKSGEELIRYVHFNIYLSASVSHCNLIDLNINYTGVDINLMPICQIWVKLVIIGERIVSIESFIRNPVCNYTQNILLFYLLFCRNFNACTPNPSKERITSSTEIFADAVLGRLKSKCLEPKVNVNMDHDIFRFLVKGKGREAADFPGSLLLEKADFLCFNMHKYWWYFLNSNGQGQTVHFPIRAKPDGLQNNIFW